MGQQLVLKSKNALTNFSNMPDYAAYKQRVELDGGVIVNEQATIDAFMFIYQKGIDEGAVFSATNPSWGIKVTDGLINKMYSLFGDSGDMIANIGGNLPRFDTSLPVPTVYFQGSNRTYFKSKGVFTSGIAASLSSIKVPKLDSYGVAPILSFPVSTLINPVIQPGETTIAGLHVTDLVRGSATDNNPLNWTKRARAASVSAASQATTPYTHGTNICAVSDGSTLKQIESGLTLETRNDDSLNIPNRITNNYAYFGHSYLATGVDANEYFLGHLAEHWVLVKDVSAAVDISIRLDALYKTALS